MTREDTVVIIAIILFALSVVMLRIYEEMAHFIQGISWGMFISYGIVSFKKR